MEEIELIITALEDWLKKLEVLEKKQPVLLKLKEKVDLLNINCDESQLVEQLKYVGELWNDLLDLLISNYDKRQIIKCILKLHGYIDENIITEILLHL